MCLVRAKAVGRDKSTIARRTFKKKAALKPGPKQLLKKKDVDRPGGVGPILLAAAIV